MKLHPKVLYQGTLYCLWADELSLSERTGTPLLYTSKGQADHESDGEVALRVRVTIEETPLSADPRPPYETLPTPVHVPSGKQRKRRRR